MTRTGLFWHGNDGAPCARCQAVPVDAVIARHSATGEVVCRGCLSDGEHPRVSAALMWACKEGFKLPSWVADGPPPETPEKPKRKRLRKGQKVACLGCGETFKFGDRGTSYRTCRVCVSRATRKSRTGSEGSPDGVPCRICDEPYLNIGSHLRAHDISSAEYQQRFPGAPLSSDAWRQATRDQYKFRTGEGAFWTREQIVSAIQKWEKRTGKPPTCRQWEKLTGKIVTAPDGFPLGRRSHPSTARVASVFGSWNAAIEAAGYAPRGRGNQGSTKARCKRGHDLTEPENVYTSPSGKRCCGICKNGGMQRWNAAHREQRTAVERERYEQNREARVAYSRAYREKNPEKVKATKRRYYERNREQILAQKRESYAAKRKAA